VADIEFINLKEVLGKIDKLPVEAMPLIERAFQKGLEDIREDAAENHPPWPGTITNPDGTWRYHNITSNLTESIGFRMKSAKEVIEGEVGAIQELFKGDAMNYATKIERDHPFVGPAVEAKKKDWLRYITEAIRSYLK